MRAIPRQEIVYSAHCGRTNVKGISDRILREYCPRRDLGSKVVDFAAERDQRDAGQISDTLLCSGWIAHVGFINHILGRHQLVALAMAIPPPSGNELPLNRLGRGGWISAEKADDGGLDGDGSHQIPSSTNGKEQSLATMATHQSRR